MIDKLVFLVFDITFFMKVTIPPKLMIFRYKSLYTKKKNYYISSSAHLYLKYLFQRLIISAIN